MWASASGALSTRPYAGCERALLPLLDEPARTGSASGLSERQTVWEVLAVLPAAGRMDGVPRHRGGDHGSRLLLCLHCLRGLASQSTTATPTAPLPRWGHAPGDGGNATGRKALTFSCCGRDRTTLFMQGSRVLCT